MHDLKSNTRFVECTKALFNQDGVEVRRAQDQWFGGYAFCEMIFGFPGGSISNDSAFNAADHLQAGDAGSIPGSGRSPEKEMPPDSSILAWEIPWAEEPGSLQSMGSQELNKT